MQKPAMHSPILRLHALKTPACVCDIVLFVDRSLYLHSTLQKGLHTVCNGSTAIAYEYSLALGEERHAIAWDKTSQTGQHKASMTYPHLSWGDRVWCHSRWLLWCSWGSSRRLWHLLVQNYHHRHCPTLRCAWPAVSQCRVCLVTGVSLAVWREELQRDILAHTFWWPPYNLKVDSYQHFVCHVMVTCYIMAEKLFKDLCIIYRIFAQKQRINESLPKSDVAMMAASEALPSILHHRYMYCPTALILML